MIRRSTPGKPAERRDTYHNVMAISLPGNAHGAHVPEQDMFILQRDPARNIVSGQRFFRCDDRPGQPAPRSQDLAMELKK